MFYSQKPIKEVLSDNNIIGQGYTNKDYKLLEFLYTNKKPVGIDCLAQYLNIPPDTYNYDIEPFLIQNGLLLRLPRGRSLSDLGKQKYLELKILKEI